MSNYSLNSTVVQYAYLHPL